MQSGVRGAGRQRIGVVVVGWAGDPPGEGAGVLLGEALDHAGEGMADPL